LSLFWFLLVGAVAGWLAGIFMKGNGFGLLGDVIVGVIGAFAGAFIFRMTGLKLGTGLADAVLIAFVGAVVLLFIVRLFAGRGSHNRMWS
jgi:uncharacterized membrane protein YeaQ/YmgE (transglycosylase-associated protein family)